MSSGKESPHGNLTDFFSGSGSFNNVAVPCIDLYVSGVREDQVTRNEFRLGDWSANKDLPGCGSRQRHTGRFIGCLYKA